METIQIEISRELAAQYIALHEQIGGGSTDSRALEEFTAAFLEDRLVEEIAFLEDELKSCSDE